MCCRLLWLSHHVETGTVLLFGNDMSGLCACAAAARRGPSLPSLWPVELRENGNRSKYLAALRVIPFGSPLPLFVFVDEAFCTPGNRPRDAGTARGRAVEWAVRHVRATHGQRNSSLAYQPMRYEYFCFAMCVLLCFCVFLLAALDVVFEIDASGKLSRMDALRGVADIAVVDGSHTVAVVGTNACVVCFSSLPCRVTDLCSLAGTADLPLPVGLQPATAKNSQRLVAFTVAAAAAAGGASDTDSSDSNDSPFPQPFEPPPGKTPTTIAAAALHGLELVAKQKRAASATNEVQPTPRTLIAASVPALKTLCERALVRLVDRDTAPSLLQAAVALCADSLRDYCLDVVCANVDTLVQLGGLLSLDDEALERVHDALTGRQDTGGAL